MNATVLTIPFFVLRFFRLDQNTLSRAGKFTPLISGEKIAYVVYQITTLLLLVMPFFLTIKAEGLLFYLGLVVYGFALFLLWVSLRDFSKPNDAGLNVNGMYRYSRNPMYLAYSVFFLSYVFLTQSLVFLAVLVVFQIAAHWIILSEERWCLKTFGLEYEHYRLKVRRYF